MIRLLAILAALLLPAVAHAQFPGGPDPSVWSCGRPFGPTGLGTNCSLQLGTGALGGNVSDSTTTATGGTTARTLAAQAADVSNVLNFGADPTGVADSSAAINAAAANVRNGSIGCVYLPAGTYYVKSALNVSCLRGDGMTLTTLTVDQGFSSTALGVLVVQAAQAFPTIENIGISFAQPTTQGTRGNFLTLAQSCTSGSGGTGCKYPPAIYDASTAQRIDMRNILISGAWDGIDLVGNVGAGTIQDIYVGALDIGFQAGGIKDWTHIKTIHFWNFGFPTADPIYSVFSDGSTLSASIQEIDGATIEDLDSFIGGFTISGAWSWGMISNLQLDGGQLNLSATSAAPALKISGFYSSYSGAGCQVNVSGAIRVIMSGVMQSVSVPAYCVSGTSGAFLQVNGGRVAQNSGAQSIATLAGTGNTLMLEGLALLNTTGADSSALIADTSDATSILAVTNDAFNPATTGGNAVTIATDGAGKIVTGNQLNGWTFTPPSSPLGFYSARGQIAGTIGGNAATGYVGEYLSSTIGSGSAVALTSGTVANVTSLALTPGDWDCGGEVGFIPTSTTSITYISGSVVNTSATEGGPSGGDIFRISQAANVPNGQIGYGIGPTRFSQGVSTTIYLTAKSTFTASTNSAFGYLWCRRAR